jgi:CRP-like cAMP-binding protein
MVEEAMPDNELAHIERVIFLQSADLFRFCDAEEILRIAAIAREIRFESGARIYEANDPPAMLYCVVRGAVEIQQANGVPRRVGPLAAFGELEILSDRLHTDSATAAEDSLLLAIEAEDFFDLLAHNIEIIKALFRRFLQDYQPATQG